MDFKYVEQKLDHFDNRNQRKFKQRYLENFNFTGSDDIFQSFIVDLGANSRIEDAFVDGCITYKIAKETNSAIFALEQRFFGDSFPENAQESDYKFLTVRQELEDISYFIDYIQKNYCLTENNNYTKCTVSIIGGSFGGSLASWFKGKYPQSVNFSYSSSSPLDIMNDFSLYDYYSGQALHKKNYQCYKNTVNILNYFNQISQNTTSEKWNDFRQQMGFDQSQDPVSELYIAATFISQMLETNTQLYLLDNYCNTQTGYMQNLTAFYDKFHEFLTIFNFTADSMDPLLTDLQTKDQKSWLWLQCNEVGLFPTSSYLFRSDQINLTYFTKVCKANFGFTNLPNNTEFNNIYGGPDPGTTMAIYTHGAVDPWFFSGIHLSRTDLSRIYMLIEGESHCTDLEPEKPTDGLSLRNTRSSIISQFKEWILGECANNCVNGRCIYGKCICDEEYQGDWCSVKIVDNSAFKYFSAMSVMLPAAITIACGIAAWFIFGGTSPTLSFASLRD